MQEGHCGQERVKRLLLVGLEKVPHGFGLRTGDPGNIADDAGNCRRPASRAQITGKNWGYLSHRLLFPEIRYP